MNNRVKLVAVCVVSLAVGYFVGREHVKYQIRSAMTDAFTGIQTALGDGNDSAKSSEPTPSPKAEKPADQPMIGTLLSKGFDPKDIHNGDFEEYIDFTVRFDNKTGKEIRAFDGVLMFTDLLDNKVLGSKVEINKPVPANGSLEWEGALDYNQFMDDHQRLRGEPKENLKTIFTANKILFADGSVQTFNQ